MDQMRAIGISLGVFKKKGSMDKLGRRACFHAVNLYDSMNRNFKGLNLQKRGGGLFMGSPTTDSTEGEDLAIIFIVIMY